METFLINIAGGVRRVVENGRKYLVAPATILVGDQAELKSSGVYLIRNAQSGKCYVGSAGLSFAIRWKGHVKHLRYNCHSNRHLQASWNKYGGEAFEFSILEQCDPSQCLAVEQKYLDDYIARGISLYNVCPTAGSRAGAKLTPEACKRNGDRFRGKPLGEQQKKNIALAQLGTKRSPEGAANIRAAQRTPEARARMSECLKNNPAFIAKVKAAHLGRKHTLEARQKMSVARKGVRFTEEHRANMSAGAFARWARQKAGVA